MYRIKIKMIMYDKDKDDTDKDDKDQDDKDK
jgi:hypothetical protein